MEKLSREQSKRLVEIISEKIPEDRRSVRNIAKVTGSSIGGVWNILHGHGIQIAYALKICERLGANPYYVLDGKGGKYYDWRKAFNGKYSD